MLCPVQSRCFDVLPGELVSRILCFLGPRDIVRLRSVSRLFHDISYDPAIWKTIYADARVPRPPGPFPFQSTHFLEQTLIRSERLAEYWTTQPIQAVSSTQIRLGGSALGHPRIIGGRWLITFESYRQIVFHDVETHTRQVLWEDTGGIASWDACSVGSAGGLVVYVVLHNNSRGVLRASWKLLEFRMHAESDRLSSPVSLDVPNSSGYSGGSVYLVSDRAPFLYLTGQHLIFDSRTRTFYEFPEFSSELAHRLFVTPRRVLLTNTHVVVVSHHLQDLTLSSAIVGLTLIQAFVLPTDSQLASGTRALCLSHEGVSPGHLTKLALTRNSVVDSATGSTSLRFLQLQPQGYRLCFSCVDLTLPRSRSDIVMPMSIKENDIFAVESGICDPALSPTGYYLEASDDGHARGFCRNRARDDDRNSSWITKFTIDATGDKCVAIVGEASLPRWIHNEDPRLSALSFDGIVGRCCYPRSEPNWRLRGFVDLVVVDIR